MVMMMMIMIIMMIIVIVVQLDGVAVGINDVVACY